MPLRVAEGPHSPAEDPYLNLDRSPTEWKMSDLGVWVGDMWKVREKLVGEWGQKTEELPSWDWDTVVGPRHKGDPGVLLHESTSSVPYLGTVSTVVRIHGFSTGRSRTPDLLVDNRRDN